jgi:hypothetical protein
MNNSPGWESALLGESFYHSTTANKIATNKALRRLLSGLGYFPSSKSLFWV